LEVNLVEATTRRRPYAATANVLSVLNRVRTRNPPTVVDADFYRVAGIGDAVHGRVREALDFLRLIDAGEPNDTPTQLLRAMGEAPEAEFKELLAGAIREAYAEDFAKIDPGQDSQAQIIDAFRRYEPRSQTPRMVMLFLGLCREAGIPVKDAPRDRKMTSPATRIKSKPSSATRPLRTTPSSAAPAPDGLLFGVTIADVAALGEEEFAAVWSALGKVARARAKPPTVTHPAEPEDDLDVDEGGDGN
jgi:Family of unknown function (DUF5343)